MHPVLQYYLGTGWTPRTIGKLVAWWDAEVFSSLLLSGSAVAAWRDVVGGASLTQSFGSSRPTYGRTSFNGRPGITFDGTDDCLERTGVSPMTSGAASGEMWALVGQSALAADATFRSAFVAGNSSGNKRELARTVASGTNRGIGATFNGTTTPTAQDTTVDFSTRHVLRAIFEPTLLTFEIDGVTTTTSISQNSTSTSRTRIGANAAGTVASFWSGPINSALGFNAPLTTHEANLVRAYLNKRRG